MRLSGKDLSEKIGCARSTLSEATKKGHRVQGRYDVQAWAEFGPNGRVRGYDVPGDAAFLSGSSARENPNEPNSPEFGGDSAPSAEAPAPDLGIARINDILEDHEETTRTVAEEAGDTTQLVSDETDVEGTARNAGMAYAAGKAIVNDTPGARAFWTVASGLAGGIGGHAVTDSPWGALIGAIAFGGVGYLAYEQKPRSQEGAAPRREQRSGQEGQKNGELAGRRSRKTRSPVVRLSR